MADLVKVEPTMWAEMKPDLYAGETCDQSRPRWYVCCAGEDGEFLDDDIVLDPKQFPPGTKIVVQEPVCPECGTVRGQAYPQPETGPMFDAKCECGFDWEDWVGNEYS